MMERMKYHAGWRDSGRTAPTDDILQVWAPDGDHGWRVSWQSEWDDEAEDYCTDEFAERLDLLDALLAAGVVEMKARRVNEEVLAEFASR